MGMTAAQYLSQLQALLPRGGAWPREPDATLTRLLQALADELARVDGRAQVLIEEEDPRTTYEMLSDWERAFGLPETCAGAGETTQQRRNALVAKVTGIGGQSRQYFIDLAEQLGYEITITEFDPFTVGDTVDDEIYGELWQFAWQVNAPQESITPFLATSSVDDPLGAWGNEQLECAINRLKPAHTTALFAYS